MQFFTQTYRLLALIAAFAIVGSLSVFQQKIYKENRESRVDRRPGILHPPSDKPVGEQKHLYEAFLELQQQSDRNHKSIDRSE